MLLSNDLQAVHKVYMAILTAKSIEALSDGFMAALPELIPHDSSFFTYSPPSPGSRDIIRSLTIEPSILEQYREYAKYDFSAWYMNQPDVSVYRDSDIISQDRIEASRIFREWGSQFGMKYVCGNVIRDEYHRFADFTLIRSDKFGDFTNNELSILDMLTEALEAWFTEFHARSGEPTPDEARCIASLPAMKLTRRESEIAMLIVKGSSTKEISALLNISYSTARTHIANIYQKCGVSSRVQLLKILMK